MPLTRSELVCLSAGIAVGALAGANADKIKNALGGLLGLMSEGVGEGYAAAAQKQRTQKLEAKNQYAGVELEIDHAMVVVVIVVFTG